MKCGDITFVETRLSESEYNSHCQNSTGVRVTQQNMEGQPNGTTSGGSSPSQTSGGASATTAKPGVAAHATAGTWLLGVAGMVALALL